MKVMKFPIIIITVFFTIGIIVNFYWRLDSTWILIANLLFAIAFGIHFWLSNRHFFQKIYFTIFTCLFSLSIGMLAQSLHYQPGYKNHYSHYISQSCVLQGTISERLKPNPYAEKYYFKITSLNKKKVFGKTVFRRHITREGIEGHAAFQ